MTGSTPCSRAVARMVGNRCSQNVGAEVPGVQPHVRVAGLDHPPGDRLGHHVARREVGELVLALHEAVALEVDEERALAADRLGDQRLLAARVGAEVHHRRVELHELQVAQRRPGAGGDAPSRRRSTPRGWWSGEKTWPSPPEASTTARQCTAPTPSRWPSPITCRVTPAMPDAGRRPASSSRSTARACSMTSISGARSTAAIRARWISAPVASPPACAIRSRGWPPSRVRRQLAVRLLGRRSCRARSARGRRAGPSVTSACTAAGSQAPAPATRVSRSCVGGGVLGSERRRDPALRPLRRAGVEDVLGDHQQLEPTVRRMDAQRRGQPGDARPDDHHVGPRGPARAPGPVRRWRDAPAR